MAITHAGSGTNVQEIAAGIFRVSTPIRDMSPVVDDAPTLDSAAHGPARRS